MTPETETFRGPTWSGARLGRGTSSGVTHRVVGRPGGGCPEVGYSTTEVEFRVGCCFPVVRDPCPSLYCLPGFYLFSLELPSFLLSPFVTAESCLLGQTLI